MNEILVGLAFVAIVVFIVWLAWRREKSRQRQADTEVYLAGHVDEDGLLIDRVIEPPE